MDLIEKIATFLLIGLCVFLFFGYIFYGTPTEILEKQIEKLENIKKIWKGLNEI